MFAKGAPATSQMPLDQMERECVVPGRHRGVGGEDRRAPHFGERRLEVLPRVEELANALQHDEGRMTLVEVVQRRRQSQRTQHADTADAQDDLLLHPRLAIAAVQARR